MAVQSERQESALKAVLKRAHPTARRDAGILDAGLIEACRRDFLGNPRYSLVQNAVTSVGVDELALDRSLVNTMEHSFSHLLDDWEVTNQKHSGRCMRGEPVWFGCDMGKRMKRDLGLWDARLFNYVGALARG